MSERSGDTMRRLRLALGLAVLAMLVAAVPAAADFGTPAGLAGFDGSVLDAAGNPQNQAGAHPDVASTTINFNTKPAAYKDFLGRSLQIPDGTPRNVDVALPAGFIGNPQAVPRCPLGTFLAQSEDGDPNPNPGRSECPDDTVVGVTATNAYVLFPGFKTVWHAPIYNLQPMPDQPALFGFRVLTQDILLKATVRTTGDYGLTVVVPNIAQAVPIFGTTATFWGVPFSHSHDSVRGDCLSTLGGSTGTCEVPADLPVHAFLSNPTRCTGATNGLLTMLHLDSWQGASFDTSFLSHDNSTPPRPLGTVDCDKVPFEPSISMQPTTQQAASPTGLDVDISVPSAGLESPDGITQSYLKDAVVKLPAGMTVNPSSASGLGGCSLAEANLDGTGDANCPPSSKIGTVTIHTPLLEDPMEGSVYLAKQQDNPFGSLLALYLVVEGPGLVVKLPGRVQTDPATGRLTATFDNNPQLPFSDLNVQLKSGPRAPLINPPRCGTYTSTMELTPWSAPGSGPPATPSDSFRITSGPGGGPCPTNRFDPGFHAGTTNPVAGTYSPFVLRLTRDDGTQELSGVTAKLPEGLTGRLAGIPYCSDAALAGISDDEGAGEAELASPSCPAASQIGTVTVGAGAGSNPFYVNTGKAYLSGPYKGAPLSLAFVTPAVAGPFDLGNVVVRAALEVNSRTAQITADSDPLPTILHGIPLDLRDVRVNIDRAGFALNPTSCEPTAVSGTITSSEGTAADVSNRFQVGDCGSLGFKPHLKLRLKGSTRRTGHPALKAVVTFPKKGRYANIARAQVGLPHSEFLDQGNLNQVCKQADLQAGTCPKKSIYGRAKAWSPLLDKPLQGPVYLGVGFGYKLPALVADLNGQIRILLVGRVDTTKHKGIRNTFEVVPDAPVSRFMLRLKGGRKYGLLENSEDICRKRRRASALFNAQNGLFLHMRPRIAAGCGKSAKAKKSHGHQRKQTRTNRRTGK